MRNSRSESRKRSASSTKDAAARRQALITSINRCAGLLLEDYRPAVGVSLALFGRND
jgi:hypothetical protein